MRKWEGYQKGVNLGGWLSQCKHTKEHYDSFIGKEDIRTIAGWGLDHVRLPVDYNLVQEKDGTFKEDGFVYIDRCIEWCRECGLNIVLDLHKTAGYFFHEEANEKGFFQSEELIQHFLKLWEEFAKRYGKKDNMAFELLNEVVEESDNEPWMKIAKRAFDIIRVYAPDIRIVLGGYWNNSVRTVKYIAWPFDENIVYDIHCYDPLVFTHQAARWVKEMPADFHLTYPVTKAAYEAEAKRTGFIGGMWALEEDAASTEYFEHIFAEAIQVAEERNVILYCGEYGVIDKADLESTVAWYKDIHAVLEKYGIGRSAWSYKQMDFGLLDERMEPIRSKVIECL